MRPGRVALAVRFTILLLVVGLVVSTPSSSSPPPLVIEAPPHLAASAASLEARSAERLVAAAELVGAGDGSPPVRVLLVPESSPTAQNVPRTISGFARTDLDLAVLLPERVPTYPDDDLSILLVHEVTHLMTARASGGGQLPRWFVEGVALLASRGWSFSDRSRVLIGGLHGAPSSSRELERMFGGSPAEFVSAYALSGALVRHLIGAHGSQVVSEILRRVAAGESFESAYEGASGEPLAVSERSFWRRVSIWYRWVPFLTSGATLWIGITALMVAAATLRRRRDAETHRRWESEESGAARPEDEPDEVVN